VQIRVHTGAYVGCYTAQAVFKNSTCEEMSLPIKHGKNMVSILVTMKVTILDIHGIY